MYICAWVSVLVKIEYMEQRLIFRQTKASRLMPIGNGVAKRFLGRSLVLLG